MISRTAIPPGSSLQGHSLSLSPWAWPAAVPALPSPSLPHQQLAFPLSLFSVSSEQEQEPRLPWLFSPLSQGARPQEYGLNPLPQCLFSLTVYHLFPPQRNPLNPGLPSIPIPELLDPAFAGKGCPKRVRTINDPVLGVHSGYPQEKPF